MREHIQIDGRKIGDGFRTFIIAEAGVNHNGNINQARMLIDVAAEAGADAVKFQAFKPPALILEGVEKARYQKRTTDPAESQRKMLEKLALSVQETKESVEYCKLKEISFLTTPFDEEILEELDQINRPACKLGSTDVRKLSSCGR